jgi:hypothetical protein
VEASNCKVCEIDFTKEVDEAVSKYEYQKLTCLMQFVVMIENKSIVLHVVKWIEEWDWQNTFERELMMFNYDTIRRAFVAELDAIKNRVITK